MFNERLAEVRRRLARDARDEVKVYRLMLSEQDRIGIGTFQPKDEKNQDSTELTGDINYRKIAEYGTDSDPRAFNFDGELNIANRGLVEFIEVLKLDVAFLYDLLGASQEHKIKPKKFAQTDIDEVILGHSVAGHDADPVPHRRPCPAGRRWRSCTSASSDDASGLEVLAHDFDDRRDRLDAGARPVPPPLHWQDADHRRRSGAWSRRRRTTRSTTATARSSTPRNSARSWPCAAWTDVFTPSRLRSWSTWSRASRVSSATDVAGDVRRRRDDRPCRAGWARLDLPRHATAGPAVYDPIVECEPLKDLITVLVWYATEGHVNGRNGGVVITPGQPRRTGARARTPMPASPRARARSTPGPRPIRPGGSISARRPSRRLCQHHCGELSANKRLPDFLFRLPTAYLQHAFDELMRTDGSRKLPTLLEEPLRTTTGSKFFEYKTISPMLAAQVGTLATLLGLTITASTAHERDGQNAGVSHPLRLRRTASAAAGTPRFEARLHERPGGRRVGLRHRVRRPAQLRLRRRQRRR